MKRILVLAAHPDDEVLGCGGTLRGHVLAGDEVHVVILADGAGSRPGGEAHKAARAASARAAAGILGIRHVITHDLPDNRLDSVPLLDLVQIVERHVREVAPDMVYTHHGGDLNIDHRRAHEAVVTACRPQPGGRVASLLFFEVPSSTEWRAPGDAAPFAPNWFVDIAGTLDTKLDALRAYADELRPWPHPRSLEGVSHLARWRGATVGCGAAEAFVLGRHIQSRSAP